MSIAVLGLPAKVFVAAEAVPVRREQGLGHLHRVQQSHFKPIPKWTFHGQSWILNCAHCRMFRTPWKVQLFKDLCEGKGTSWALTKASLHHQEAPLERDWNSKIFLYRSKWGTPGDTSSEINTEKPQPQNLLQPSFPFCLLFPLLCSFLSFPSPSNSVKPKNV